jgi:hypothetical protein
LVTSPDTAAILQAAPRREDPGPLARLVDMLRTLTFTTLFVLALCGALAQALRGQRPALLARG